MAEHNDLGIFGEEKSCDFLEKKGYIILEKNYRYQKAEIDIIALKDDILCIVEVKTRKNKDFGTPESFVNPKKIQLLVKATQAYIEKKDLDVEVRFDIIAITMQPNLIIEHIENAYYHF